MSIIKKDEATAQILESIRNLQNNRGLSEQELKKKIKSAFGGSLRKFKSYLETVAIDMGKFGERPQAYYWVAVMDNTFGNIKSKGTFNPAEGERVVKSVLDILFAEEEINIRIKKVEAYLDGVGIILRGSEFVQGSNINACTLNKSGQIYMFLNDKQKREYQYIFALVKELKYLYTEKVNNTAKLIKFYEEKYNKSHKELDIAMDIFESDELMEMKWELLRAQTSKRIDFRSDQIKF